MASEDKQTKKVVVVDGATLTVEDVVAVARDGARVELSAGARETMAISRVVVEAYVYGYKYAAARAAAHGVVTKEGQEKVAALEARLGEEPRVAYGITTGFGELAHVRVPVEDAKQLQYNLVRSHSVGAGPLLPRDAVRASMLIRANTLATGISGVRPCCVDKIIEFLNADITPKIPCQGSVGSSGDLAPTAHMALALIGEGPVFYEGRECAASDVLARLHIAPLELESKEGLALINGTQVMTGVGALAVHDAELIYKAAMVAACMSTEAMWGSVKPYDPRIHACRAHPGQIRAANAMARITAGSAIVESHKNCARVQDSYSMRCAPQVIGPCIEQIERTRATLEIEMNSATDNPLVFANEGEVYSNGNFHGEPVAIAMDCMKIALCELASIAERRCARLVDPHVSGLPAFLTRRSGLNSGFMMAQYTAAALVSENKVLAHPASVDSIPTSANQEDHVSMGTIAARQCAEIARNSMAVIGIELFHAAQGIDLHDGVAPGVGTAAAMKVIRAVVPFVDQDRVLSGDMEQCKNIIADGSLVRAVEAVVGPL